MASENFEPSNKYFSHFISFNLDSHSQGFLVITLFFFFSVILIVTFLILHFFFHPDTNTHLSTNITAASTQLSSSTITVAVPAITLGLDAATINSIPIFLHGARSSAVIDINIEREECCICLGLFEDDEMVKVLPECLHAYHSDCVDKWLKNRSSCPLCRSSLDSTSTTKSISEL